MIYDTTWEENEYFFVNKRTYFAELRTERVREKREKGTKRVIEEI